MATVALLASMAGTPALAVEPFALYDDFNAGAINPDKWFGSQAGFLEEASRLAKGGRLGISFRAWGDTTSNTGSRGSNLRLNFSDPAAVTAIKATVTINRFTLTDCPLNPTPFIATGVRARLFGFFFNAGTPTPGDFTNDVNAHYRIVRRADSADPPGVFRAVATIDRCDDATCSGFTTLFASTLGTVATGVPATISIQWDQPNHQFFFRLGATTVAAPYTVSDTSPPANPNKQIGDNITIPNCMAVPRPNGFIDASFDDVFVNAFAATLRRPSVRRSTRPSTVETK